MASKKGIVADTRWRDITPCDDPLGPRAAVSLFAQNAVAPNTIQTTRRVRVSS